MVLAICNDPKILEAALLAKTIISFLEIAAPLMVVLIGGFDIIKAVTSNSPDAIKKQTGMIPKRLLIMAILFFVPLFVDITMQTVDSSFEYTSCFTGATKENIRQTYLNIAREQTSNADLLSKSEETKAFDVKDAADKAKIAILKIENEADRNVLEKQLLEINARIQQKEKKEEEEKETGPLLSLRGDAYKSPDGTNNTGTTNPGSGKLPYYNQCDAPWGTQTFYTDTYCRQSCGATSLSMVVAGIGNNTSANPITIGDKMKSMGLPATFVSYDAFTNSSFLSSFGIKGTAFGTGSDKNATLAKMEAVLTEGKPVIINLPGHYVVIDHIQNGKFHMLDPGTKSYNGYYTGDELWKEILDYKGRGGPRYAYFYFERG